MLKYPAAFEIWGRKATSRQSVFGTQNCLYLTLPQSSCNKRYKISFSTTRRLKCIRYLRDAIGQFSDSPESPGFFHEITFGIISSFCCSRTKSRGCVRFGQSLKMSSEPLVSIKSTCEVDEKEKNPVI